jgi:hypothetical protein
MIFDSFTKITVSHTAHPQTTMTMMNFMKKYEIITKHNFCLHHAGMGIISRDVKEWSTGGMSLVRCVSVCQPAWLSYYYVRSKMSV